MSTLRTNTISNAGGTASVPVDTVVSGSAKAWVNFNGTGTVAIRQAFNVTSITDNGVGDYTVNFTSAMADANYSAVGVSQYGGSGVGANRFSLHTTTPQATGSVRIATGTQDASGFQVFNDSAIICVSIFR